MRVRSLLLLLLGVVAVLFLNVTTTQHSIQRLNDQAAELWQMVVAVHQQSYARDVDLAQRVSSLEDLDMSGVLRAMDNTVVVFGSGGYGSGIVLADGYVLTAGHCVFSMPMSVRKSDGSFYAVTDACVSADYDVAILRVPGIEGEIELCPVDEVELFDAMYVIGAPFDQCLSGSVSEGIFTDFDRDYYYWQDAFQITCDAGPGNSGGPVVDARGRLVGIVVGGPDPGGAVTIIESITHIVEALVKYEPRN